MSLGTRGLVALVISSLLRCPLPAEVPPLSEEVRKNEAVVVVTGTVVRVQAGKEEPRASGTETEYRLTVRVRTVNKGELKKGAEPLVARGWSVRLKPGTVGPRGHRSANTADRIADVGNDWELVLYLKSPQDGVYDIVPPNGLEVLKKPPEGAP